MKTPEEWWEYWKICDGDISIITYIKTIQDEAYLEGQLAGLQMGKETAMKTISEVFSKTAE